MPSQAFPAVPASVPEARSYVTALLARLAPDVCETAALLVSELATNAVRHAGTQVGQRFRLRKRGAPRLGGNGRGDLYAEAHVVVPTVTDEHGRGLRLVGALADRWGAHRRRDTDAKTVWFELNYTRPDAASADRTHEAERTA